MLRVYVTCTLVMWYIWYCLCSTIFPMEKRAFKLLPHYICSFFANHLLRWERVNDQIDVYSFTCVKQSSVHRCLLVDFEYSPRALIISNLLVPIRVINIQCTSLLSVFQWYSSSCPKHTSPKSVL
jgi:hypothetical protein